MTRSELANLTWQQLEVEIAKGTPGSYTEECIRLAEIELGIPRYMLPEERMKA